MARKDRSAETATPEDQTTSTPAEGEASGETAGPSTIDFTIQGLAFTASAPYAQGHVLTVAEANTLNQTRVENVRNNFAARIKTLKDAASKEEPPRDALTDEEIAKLRADFAEYEASYEFAGKRQSRAPVDPVAREEQKMARETIVGALRANKIDPKDLAEGKLDELIKDYLGKHPEVHDEAVRRVDAAKSAATDALDGIDVTSMLKPAEAAVEAPVEAPAEG